MKIQNTNICLYNNSRHGTLKKQNILNSQAPSKNLLIPDVHSLNAMFNINFCGNAATYQPYNLDTFSNEFSQKIAAQIKSEQLTALPHGSAIKSAHEIDLLNKAFKADGITGIYKSGISLNNALNYLAIKKQIQFCEADSEKTAFLIDELSTDYIKSLKDNNKEQFNKLKEGIEQGQIILYQLTSPNSSDKKTLADFCEILECSPNKVNPISNDCSDYVKFPDAQTIKKLITSFAEYKFPEDKGMQEKLTQTCIKYLHENFLYFSFQTLALRLREQYHLIEEQVKSTGKTMEDVIYVIPESDKSYDFINYIYAAENRISADKFIPIDRIAKEIPEEEQAKKVYVVLDDMTISGLSLYNTIGCFNSYMSNTQMGIDLIIAPLIYTPEAKGTINVEAQRRKKENNANIKFVSANEYNTIGSIGHLQRRLRMFGTEEEKNELKEQLKKLKYMNEDDIDFILKNLLNGYNDLSACIILPYMIPDNSSELTTLLGGYFLNNDCPESNKGIEYGKHYAGERISLKDYTQLKAKIG